VSYAPPKLADLGRILAPLQVRRDLTTDSTLLIGSRVRGKLDNCLLTTVPRPIEAVDIVLQDMARTDPFVARYRRDEEVEIHPVFGGATTMELLAWP